LFRTRTVLAWVFSYIWDDYRIMLYALLSQHFLTVVISHVMAERRFEFVWDFSLMKRAFSFGWPLLINGGLLFIIFNGEKIIVGRELGMIEFALFAMMFTFTLTPTLVLQTTTRSFFLPQLSAEQSNDAAFTRLSHVTLQIALLVGILLTVGFAIVGPPVVGLLLGEKYYPGLALLVWLAIAQSVRVAKMGSAIVSVARAFTNNSMIANGPRVLAMPLAWYLVSSGYGIMALITVAIIAEIVGYLISLHLVRTRVNVEFHLHGFQLVYIAAGLVAIASMKETIAYVMNRTKAPG